MNRRFLRFAQDDKDTSGHLSGVIALIEVGCIQVFCREEIMTASAKFFFTVRPGGESHSFIAVCTISGDAHAFHSLKRRFGHIEEIERALTDAGISRERYTTKLQQLNGDNEASFEVDQNEAQKIGILNTESTE